MADKGFPCATCQELGGCKPALELYAYGQFLEKELPAIGGAVKAIGITCPKDGVTYRTAREATNDRDK